MRGALAALAAACAVSGALASVKAGKLRESVQGMLEAASAEVGSGPAAVSSVVLDPRTNDLKVERGKSDRAVAWGTFVDGIEETGWGKLSIHTSRDFEDAQQAFAAGYLEAYLTHVRIRQFAHNIQSMRDESAEDGLRRYFHLQASYLDGKVQESRQDPSFDRDGFWHHAHLVWRQFEGLVKGYNRHCGEGNELDAFQLWVINMDGDNIELEQAISRGAIALDDEDGSPSAQSECGDCDGSDSAGSDGAGDPMSGLISRASEAAADSSAASLEFRERGGAVLTIDPGSEQAPYVVESDEPGARERAAREEQAWARKMRKSRCSAMVKLLPGNADLLVAHTSWEDYVEMMRVFKHYNFDFTHPKTRARTVSFSSYPAMVSSTDDWYVLSSGLLVTETTVNLMSDDIFAKMSTRSLASWIRSMAASRLAADGPAWAALYAKENSGTYNCHWMIVDYNKFKPGEEPPENTFYVVETVPGLAVGDDMTPALKRRSYWPSVNRPFFRRIREAAGYPLHDRLVDGVDFLSFERNLRGQQLAKLQKTIVGSPSEALAAMKLAIRHNDPKGDSTQRGKPSYAVAARYDLADDAERTPSGATDAKVAGSRDVKAMRTHAQCGPTTEDGNLPFSFVGEWASIPHEGMPTTFDFPWVVMQPT